MIVRKGVVFRHFFDTQQELNDCERGRLAPSPRMETWNSRMEECPMKKVLISLAAATIMVAGFATSADAQRGRGGGGGFSRGGGVGFVGGGGGGRFVGGGFRRAGFVGGPGFRRAGFVGGPGFRRAAFVGGGPGWWGGRRWVGGRWWGGRRFVRAGFVGAGFVGAGFVGGCQRWTVVATPWGPQWRLVNVCFSPVGYGWGGGWGGYGGYW